MEEGNFVLLNTFSDSQLEANFRIAISIPNLVTYLHIKRRQKSNWTAQEKCLKFFAASIIKLSKERVRAKMMNQSGRIGVIQ